MKVIVAVLTLLILICDKVKTKLLSKRDGLAPHLSQKEIVKARFTEVWDTSSYWYPGSPIEQHYKKLFKKD